jgi:hypothetical protein
MEELPIELACIKAFLNELALSYDPEEEKLVLNDFLINKGWTMLLTYV